eukprot:15226657-Alexandrium_andersonii.AAC.1
MSASLVGSEMCIRDRSRCPRTSTSLPSWCSGASSATSESWCSAPRPRPPVSYTHLTLPTICSV